MFILQHQGTEQEHPKSQQEAERKLQEEEEPTAGLQEIPGTIVKMLKTRKHTLLYVVYCVEYLH